MHEDNINDDRYHCADKTLDFSELLRYETGGNSCTSLFEGNEQVTSEVQFSVCFVDFTVEYQVILHLTNKSLVNYRSP